MRFAARGTALLYALGLYAFLLLPLAVLACRSAWGEGAGIAAYLALARDAAVVRALVSSAAVALASSLAAVLLAGPAAYALVRHRPRHAIALRRTLLAPLATGYATVGIGLLALCVGAGWPLGLWTVGIAHLMIALPVCFIIFALAVDDGHVACERAARDLGASESALLREVTLPMLTPAAVAAFLLSALLSWAELAAAFLVSGSSRTLPLVLLDRVGTDAGSAAPLAMAMLALSAIPAALLVRLLLGRGPA